MSISCLSKTSFYFVLKIAGLLVNQITFVLLDYTNNCQYSSQLKNIDINAWIFFDSELINREICIVALIKLFEMARLFLILIISII